MFLVIFSVSGWLVFCGGILEVFNKKDEVDVLSALFCVIIWLIATCFFFIELSSCIIIVDMYCRYGGLG